LHSTAEPLLAREIVTVLGKIGGPDAENALAGGLDQPAFVVREAALVGLVARGRAAAKQRSVA